MANKNTKAANKPEQKQYLTIGEVSNLSGLSYAAVKRDVDGGRLPAHRIGRKYLLPAAAAEDYIRSRRAEQEVDGYTIGELDAGNTTDPKTLTFPALTTSLREWDVIFAATNAQSADDTDDVFYLYRPESLTTIAQKLGITWQYENVFVYGETFYGIVPANSGGEVVTQPNDEVSEIFLGMSFLNQFDHAIDWKMQVYAWNENEGDTMADAYTIYTDSGVLQQGARHYFEDAGDSIVVSLVDIADPTLANTLIAINFQYKDTRNSGYISKHFNLLSGSLDQYEASAGVSLYDLR